MTVTQIEPFERGKGRVAIYLNHQLSFVLYKGELLQYGIEVGSEIDSILYDRIINETLGLRAKKRGMNLLMRMDRTESDVRNKLRDGGYPPEAIDIAIDYLKSYHYIDDYRYATDYVAYKSSSMSSKQIALKLSQKGITKDIISLVLNEQMENGGSREFELIEKLILKRCRNNIGDMSYEDKQKLFGYLYNKGFAISDIEKVYDNLARS